MSTRHVWEHCRKFPPTASPSVSKQTEHSNFFLAGWLKGCRYCWLPGINISGRGTFLTVLDLLISAVSPVQFWENLCMWSCNLKFMQAFCEEITWLFQHWKCDLTEYLLRLKDISLSRINILQLELAQVNCYVLHASCKFLRLKNL